MAICMEVCMLDKRAGMKRRLQPRKPTVASVEKIGKLAVAGGGAAQIEPRLWVRDAENVPLSIHFILKRVTLAAAAVSSGI